MICSTYNHINISTSECRQKIRNLLLNGVLPNGQICEPTLGMVLNALHEIKRLPADERLTLWQELRDGMSQADYDKLHKFYVEWTLGIRWSR